MTAAKSTFKWMRAVLTVALLYMVYRREDPKTVWDILTGIQAGPLVLLFSLYLINTFLSAWKWHLFLKADGITVPLNRLVQSYLVGSFLNLFLPSNIGGDAYRVYDVAKQSSRAAHSFASVLADRLSGFIALVVLGLVAGAAGYQQLPDHALIWLPMAAMTALALVTALLFQQRLIQWFLDKPPLNRIVALTRLAKKIFESIQQYRRAPFLFVKIMIISFLFQANVIFCIYTLSLGLGLDIAPIFFCVFVPIISLIEALPISIFGLGIRDASYAYFFGSVGVEPVAAKSIALAYVVITILYSAFGGLILMYRTLRTSPSASTA